MATSSALAGQVSKSAAEIYDEFFVPSLFGEWAPRLCEAAQLSAGDRVLDVACGTGATTREAAARVGDKGRVIGLDRNPDMLSVARGRAADMDWCEAMAEAIPFDAGTFDAVLCQFGLMFFENRSAALQEMARVVRPGGHVALSVWDKTSNSPGYNAMIALIEEMFGPGPADALRAPFVLGDRAALGQTLVAGGIGNASVTTVAGTARFASIAEWVRLDVKGWTLTDYIDNAGFDALVSAAQARLGRFAGPDGSVAFAAPAHIAVWTA